MISNSKNNRWSIDRRMDNKSILLTVWTALMQRKNEQLPLKVKVIALLIGCFLASAVNIYLIANSLLGQQRISVAITPLKQSKYAGLTGTEHLKASAVISPAEYQKILAFNHYLDSLSKSDSGRIRHPDFQKQRPGLMNSIRFLENLYQSQNKN